MKIEKIDMFGGGVVAGKPEKGDVIRVTHDNGSIEEKIYWKIDIPAPPIVDQEVKLRGEIRRRINDGTAEAIAAFAYGSKTYNLTDDVIDQVRDFAGLLLNASDPAKYFPLEVVIGDNDAYDVVQTLNTAAAFRTVYVAIMEHIKEKRTEARALKTALDTLTLSELEAWVDPRL